MSLIYAEGVGVNAVKTIQYGLIQGWSILIGRVESLITYGNQHMRHDSRIV